MRRALDMLATAMACLAAGGGALAAPIVPGSPTTAWTPIDYPGLTPDFADDQQTGITEADLVGDGSNPAFYTIFDDAGTGDLQDGNLGFRVRVGADKSPAGFGHFLGVGFDADLDGALDLFLGVDNSGNPDQLGIFDAGTGLNVSPSTTSIDGTPLVSYVPGAGNYDFRPVDATSDPTATSFDLDADGNTDFFLSFVIPFDDVVAQLAAQGITGVNQNTTLRYVVGSSTQPNALNQDLGGPNGGTTSTTTWEALGALSSPITAFGVPEPSSVSLVAGGLLALGLARRRRTAARAQSRLRSP